MAISEPQASIVDSQQDYVMVGDDESESEEESEYQTDDDSEEDPTYDIVKETCSSLSKLSIKKSKPRVCEKLVLESKRELDYDVPELDAVDQKSFENVEKIIQAGDLEKLKIDQCKVYLRKHGLRLTGTKNVLIARIQEHLGIIDGGGEKKYPVSSFVLNCKGDACTGDVVMFEQNVYDMYNIASRSASGPLCGTRTIAGRIVKESYGAAKQQHTFTIEVLWSKGIKPLPPLHPLLIKGRNLYRLKTMRQVWTDEEDRRKILQEKHSRGSLARCNRDTRMQEKEMRKIHKGKRETRKNSSNSNKGGQDQQAQSNPIKPSFPLQQTVQLPQQPVQLVTRPPFQQHKPAAPQAQQPIEFQPNHILGNSTGTKNTSFSEQWKGQTNDRFTGAGNHHSQHILPYPPRAGNHQNNNFGHYPSLKSPPRANHMHHLVGQYHRSHVLPYRNENVPPPMTTGSSTFLPKSPQRWRGPMPIRQQQQKQTCRHYVQGRCHFGDRCKFLHEN